MTMLGIIETATNRLLEVVPHLDGMDMTGCHVVTVPQGYDPEYFEWNSATSAFEDLSLARAQAQAIAVVNTQSEVAYGAHLHGAIGATLYPIKESQARAWKSAANPADSDYPLLYAEVGITGTTISDVVHAIIAKADSASAAREAAAVLIEPVRQQAQIDIIRAASVTDVWDVVNKLIFPNLDN